MQTRASCRPSARGAVRPPSAPAPRPPPPPPPPLAPRPRHPCPPDAPPAPARPHAGGPGGHGARRHRRLLRLLPLHGLDRVALERHGHPAGGGGGGGGRRGLDGACGAGAGGGGKSAGAWAAGAGPGAGGGGERRAARGACTLVRPSASPAATRPLFAPSRRPRPTPATAPQELMAHKLVFIETQDVVETSLALDNFRRACDCGRGAVFFRRARAAGGGRLKSGVVQALAPPLSLRSACEPCAPPAPASPCPTPTCLHPAPDPSPRAAWRAARWRRASTLTATTGAAWSCSGCPTSTRCPASCGERTAAGPWPRALLCAAAADATLFAPCPPAPPLRNPAPPPRRPATPPFARSARLEYLRETFQIKESDYLAFDAVGGGVAGEGAGRQREGGGEGSERD